MEEDSFLGDNGPRPQVRSAMRLRMICCFKRCLDHGGITSSLLRMVGNETTGKMNMVFIVFPNANGLVARHTSLRPNASRKKHSKC